jgi:hypothetical protein
MTASAVKPGFSSWGTTAEPNAFVIMMVIGSESSEQAVSRSTYIGFKVCNDLIVLHIKYKFGRNTPQRLVGRQIASALMPD